MELTNYVLLNRVFTRNTIKDMIMGRDMDLFFSAARRYISNPEGKENIQIISEIYKKLDKNYRNEYFYKNTLFNKLLLGVHSPRTTTALTEVSIAKSKADLILINGKAVVYEIKTELDNLDRLRGQIEDYYKAFSEVAVVVSESNFKAITNMFNDTSLGIYVLTDRNTLSLKKPSIENLDCLDCNTMFKVMRKPEYESVLLKVYDRLPEVSQFTYYSECKKMFSRIEKKKAYDLFIRELKNRCRIDFDLYSSVPYELKFLTYFLDLKKNDYQKLSEFLNSKFGG